MRALLLCLVAAPAFACGIAGSTLTPRGQDDAGLGEAGIGTDAGAIVTRDADSSTAASATACFPDGASADAAAPLGALCVPLSEEFTQWPGSNAAEVITESNTPACGSGVCVVNHFRGRVSCPGGQSAAGQGPDGAAGCLAPGTCGTVTVPIQPQCADRPASQTVYCSCRCANASGRTDDGATYCTCPSTMTCVQLIVPIGGEDAGNTLAGAYCIKVGTEYGPDAACR